MVSVHAHIYMIWSFPYPHTLPLNSEKQPHSLARRASCERVNLYLYYVSVRKNMILIVSYCCKPSSRKSSSISSMSVRTVFPPSSSMDGSKCLLFFANTCSSFLPKATPHSRNRTPASCMATRLRRWANMNGVAEVDETPPRRWARDGRLPRNHCGHSPWLHLWTRTQHSNKRHALATAGAS